MSFILHNNSVWNQTWQGCAAWKMSRLWYCQWTWMEGCEFPINASTIIHKRRFFNTVWFLTSKSSKFKKFRFIILRRCSFLGIYNVFWSGYSTLLPSLFSQSFFILQQQTKTQNNTFGCCHFAKRHNPPRACVLQLSCADSEQSPPKFQMDKYRSSTAPKAKPKKKNLSKTEVNWFADVLVWYRSIRAEQHGALHLRREVCQGERQTAVPRVPGQHRGSRCPPTLLARPYSLFSPSSLLLSPAVSSPSRSLSLQGSIPIQSNSSKDMQGYL